MYRLWKNAILVHSTSFKFRDIVYNRYSLFEPKSKFIFIRSKIYTYNLTHVFSNVIQSTAYH